MRRLAVVALAGMLALTGCSQVSALAPVGGDRVTSVRYAVNDVLAAADIPILTAPTCTAAEDGAVACAGEAVDGSKIRASSPATDQDHLTVKVGDRTRYDGSLTAVLDDALEGDS